MIRIALIAVIIAAPLVGGDASATGTIGEAVTKAYEERAEAQHRKSWCRWRWIRENMLVRTLADVLFGPCPPPPDDEMRRWKAERKERQQRGKS